MPTTEGSGGHIEKLCEGDEGGECEDGGGSGRDVGVFVLCAGAGLLAEVDGKRGGWEGECYDQLGRGGGDAADLGRAGGA